MRPPTPPSDDPDAPLPRQKFLQMLPRRSLYKIAALLALLAAVIYFQRRAERVVRQMTNVISPERAAAPAPAGSSPSAPRRP